MKNLKKMLAAVLSVAMVGSMAIAPTFAATYSYEKEANELNTIGLYKGIDEKVFNPDLGASLDRQTGVVMLLRIFGQEDEALKLSMEQADTMLAKFKDAGTIAEFAKRQVAFAVEKGIVKGYAADSTFRPAAALNGKAYSSLILQQLGYDGDFDYKTAATKLSEIGGLTATQASAYNSDAGIIKDDLVGISYGTLEAKFKADGVKLIKSLITSGDVKVDDLKKTEIKYLEIKSVAAIADVTVDIGAAATLPATVKATYEDDTTADVSVTWPTVDTSKDGEQTIEGVIADTTVKATVKVIVAPAELRVEGVSSDNLKEIIVTFSRAIADADKAETEANYTVKVGSTSKGVDLATLSEDKKSVALTLTNAVKQQDKVDVTVKKEVGLTADATKSIDVIKDTTLPVASSIKLTGPNTFDITFSEPVQVNSASGSLAEVLVNNGIYGVVSKDLSANKRVLSVKIGVSSLGEGTYKVKVSNFSDFANFNVLSNTFELAYLKDTTAPVATLKSASQTEAIIVFDKAVFRKDKSGNDAKLTVDYFYHTYTAWKPVSVTTTDNKEFILSFNDGTGGLTDYYLPEGNVVVTVLKTAGDVEVVDAWGNKMADDAKLAATITVDKEAPTVTKVEATAENKVEITYSETLNQTSAETEENYVIKDSSAKKIEKTFDATYNSADKKVTLTISSALTGGTYTLEIKDIKDSSLAENKMVAVTKEFVVTDKTAIDPTAIKAAYLSTPAGEPEYIYVTFPEDMKVEGVGSILDKNNYRLNGAKLHDDATIEIFGSNKKVKITVPETVPATLVTGTLTVGRFADAAGNLYDALSTGIALSGESAPEMFKVTTKELNKIEIDIKGKVTTVSSDSFTVSGSVYGLGGIESISYAVNDDDKLEHTLILATLRDVSKLATSDSKPTNVTVVADKVKSDTGKAMAAGAFTTNIVDGIAPAFVAPTTDAAKKVSTTGKVITLTFDENVKAKSNDYAATDIIVTYDGAALVAGTDYTLAVSTTGSTTATLTFIKALTAGKTVKVETKSAVNYITDASANKAKAFSQEYTVE
ncbi:Ig-like domain-containing protein [Acetivibrio cellulolyticus]|uniref:Ig-like domain-containing protein n=1 Tax=Acetivibrio cellulolyticus TaxID=35830 RepID=UPI0001E2F117|nr:Ig-like domain-containing protein [Acetivibrio cellulolyticus]